MGDLKNCYQNKNVGFISTRLAGTDGVSLETKKWADVFESEGYKSFYFAGELDRESLRKHGLARSRSRPGAIRGAWSEEDR